MKRRGLVAVVAAFGAVVLAGCYAQTEPASDVGSTAATLNAHGYTTAKSGQAFFQYSSAKIALGTGFGLQTPTLTFPPDLSGPFTARVSGLSPGTNYWFRVCGNDVGDQPHCNSDLEFTTTVPGAPAAFAGPLAVARTVPVSASVLGTGDFNADGIPDLVVADPSNLKFDVLVGNGDATFRQTATIDVGSQPFTVALGDFNRDGRQDLVVGSIFPPGNGPPAVAVFPGKGDGTFGAPLFTTFTNGLVVRLVPGDFNRDGVQDLALLGQTIGRGARSSAQVMIGNGNGTFQPPDQSLVAQGGDSTSGARWTGLVVGDLNGDGNPDLALTKQACSVTPSACGVSVFLGNGNGLVGPEHVYDPGTDALALVSGALHGGSRLDLLAQTTSGLTVLNGAGDGSFQVGPTYAPAEGPAQVADVNGDGRLDLVATTGGGTDVWPGDGNGMLRSPVKASTSCAVGASTTFGPAGTVADFNGDGKPDVACSQGSAGPAVLLNATPPPG